MGPIERALAESDSCAVLIGPNGFGSWHFEEMRAAIDQRVGSGGVFRVIPVLLPGAERPERSRLPTFLTATTWVEFRDSLDDSEAFRRLVCGIRGVEPGYDPGEAPFAGQCPYRGLQPFDEAHAAFFFGREALTEWLLDALRVRPLSGARQENRFLAVIGPSGSGKSSLALAGLVPALERGEAGNKTPWSVVTFRPGHDPAEALAVQLDRMRGGEPDPARLAGLIDSLSTDQRTLHLLTRQVLSDAHTESRLVVLVDQFEEVFTLCEDDGSRQALFDNLLHASSVAGGQTVVVLTLRADFYGKCASYSALSAALSEHQMLVGPMTNEELRRAIERPAQLVGCELESGLVDFLLQGQERQAGALPLLQDALRELWERREGRKLTCGVYQAMGGLEGALENRANKILAELEGHEQDLCRRVFLRLIQPGEGTEDTKRRARMRDRVAIDGDANSRVVQKLVDARLLTAEGDVEGRAQDSGAVEVAHEALIRGWKALRQWIDADRAGLRTHHRLLEAANEWQDGGWGSDFLYTGARLAVAREWAAKHGEELIPLEAAFLNASVEAEQQEEAERVRAKTEAADRVAALEREKAERASERLRRSRPALAAAVVALIVTGALAAVAVTQRQRAEMLKAKATLAEGKAVEKEQIAEKSAEAARQQGRLALATLNAVIFDIQRGVENLPGSSQVRRRLLDTALRQLEKLSGEYTQQSAADRDTAAAFIELGDLMLQFGGGPGDGTTNPGSVAGTGASTSAMESARGLFARSLGILEALSESDPSNAQAKLDLALPYRKLGSVHLQLGATDKALEMYQKGLELNDALAKADPSSAQAKRDLSVAYEGLGDVHLLLDANDKSLEMFQKALLLREALAKADPSNAEAKRDLAVSYNRLGDVQRRRGATEQARVMYQTGLELSEALAKADPSNVQAKRDLAVSYNRLGDLHLQLGVTDKVLEMYQKLLELCEALAKADPSSAEAKRDLSISYNKIGDLHLKLGATEKALEVFQKGRELSEALAKADPSNALAKRDLSISYNKIGGAHLKLGATEKALEMFQKDVELSEALARTDPASIRARQDLSVSLSKLANAHEQAKHPAEARRWYEKMLALDRRLSDQIPESAAARREVASDCLLMSRFCARTGDWPAALEYAQQELEHARAARTIAGEKQPFEWDFSITFRNVADAQVAMGRTKEAIQSYEEGIKADPKWALLYMKLGDLHSTLGASDKAVQTYESGVTLVEAQVKADPKNVQLKRELSVWFNRLGDAQLTRPMVERALEMYQKALDLCEARVRADPRSIEAQEDVSLTLSKIARRKSSANILSRRDCITRSCWHLAGR